MAAEDTFLKHYIRYNSGTEIPDIFALWCGISAVSAAMGRSCWFDMGVNKLFPNFYIILVAGSGMCRKSTAIKQVNKVVSVLDPKLNFAPQKVTPEAFIESMRQVQVGENLIQFDERCEAYGLISEMSTFLNKHSYDAGLAALLIEGWDCADRFLYKTKGRGDELLTNMCFGFVAGSTVDWIRNAFTEDAIAGGLASRIIFVYVRDPSPPVPSPDFDAAKLDVLEQANEHIRRINKMSGPFTMTLAAKRLYEDEYIRFFKSSKLRNDRNTEGYASRRPGDHTFKLAMVLSAAQSSNRIIEANHMDGAIKLLKQTEHFLPYVMSLIASSQKGQDTQHVYHILRKYGELTKEQLMQLTNHRLDMRGLNDVLDTLKSSGRVDIKSTPAGISYICKNTEERFEK